MKTNTLHLEAIIFDIGGVLWQPPDTPLSATWAYQCGLDVATFDKLVYASQWGEQALRGEITSEQMWQRIG
jgi:hypothetical protein